MFMHTQKWESERETVASAFKNRSINMNAMIKKLTTCCLVAILCGLVVPSSFVFAAAGTVRRVGRAPRRVQSATPSPSTSPTLAPPPTGISPEDCATDGTSVMMAILEAQPVIYLCDGFIFYPTTSMGDIKDGQKTRIICMGTCTIDGSLKPNSLPRELFTVRSGGVLQLYGVNVVNLVEVRFCY
jgi:hypothetical protein